MPSLATETVDFLRTVKDNLRFGNEVGDRATAEIGSGANGTVELTTVNPGGEANDWTVEVTAPGGTSALAVTTSGTAITVALSVSTGTPVTADNTAIKVAAAINAAVPDVFAAATGTGADSLSSAEGPTSFTGGSEISPAIHAAGANYIRAQDMAAVLELLQEGTNVTSNLTATGGSTTTAVVSSITSDAYAGATVTFDSATTTAALQGETATVLSNDGTTFTFTEALPAAVVSGDEFTVTQGFVDTEIDALRGGRGLGAAPPSNAFALYRPTISGLAKLEEQLSGSAFSGRTITHGSVTTAAGSTDTVIAVSETLRVDEFKGLDLVISGETRRVVNNTDTTITVSSAFSSAPSSGTTYAVSVPAVDILPVSRTFTHAGGHPSNYVLADLIETVERTILAFTLPS